MSSLPEANGESSFANSLLRSLFANIFMPHFRVRRDEFFQQLAAIPVIEIDDLDTVGAEPLQAAGEGAALAHNHSTDAKLPHQPAAVPTGSQRGNHNQIAIAALTPGAAKRIGFAVYARVALLHSTVAPAAYQFSRARKKCGPDRNSAFRKSHPRLFERHIQHPPVLLKLIHRAI
jgi:hypothetical protein